jgi:hypothetical protein
MRTIRRFVYWIGIRPKRGIFFSPTLHLRYEIPSAVWDVIRKGLPSDFFTAETYTNQFGYCNDPFCDLEDAHKHGPLCHMNCICKRKAPDGGQ